MDEATTPTEKDIDDASCDFTEAEGFRHGARWAIDQLRRKPAPAADTVKVPEPVELIRCGSCGLPDMVFLKDYNTLLDLLRRETVAKEEGMKHTEGKLHVGTPNVDDGIQAHGLHAEDFIIADVYMDLSLGLAAASANARRLAACWNACEEFETAEIEGMNVRKIVNDQFVLMRDRAEEFSRRISGYESEADRISALDEQIAYAQQLVNDGKYPEYATAILASLQRLAQYEAVKVPEPAAWWNRKDLDVSFGPIRPMVQGEWRPFYGPELIDPLRRETVLRKQAKRDCELAIAHDRQPYPTAWAYEQVCKAKEKAEAERDALQDRLNSMESLYVSTIKPGDWIEP